MFSGLPCGSHIAHIAHIARTRGRVAAPPARHRSLPAPRSEIRLRYRRRSDFRLRSLSEVGFPTSVFCPKNPSPGQRRRSVSEAVLAGATGRVFLAWAQDCSCQSCCGNRIASTIPVLATGLPRRSSGLELFLPEHRLVMESARL